LREALFRLSEVGFGFEPGRRVLEQVSLQLGPGERLALSGAIGSGKTTLLHLMVGLLHPATGTIEAFGTIRRCEADFREVRRRAGLLFQDSDDQLFCPTVAEDIAFGPLNLGASRAEARRVVDETLDRLGLAGFAHRVTPTLSGGEKRLVALATILAMRPDVLLLDEPTTGLDAATEARLTEILTALPQAMVIISHDQRCVERLATRRLWLQGGRLEE